MKNIYVDSSAYIRVKGGERGVRIMSLWLFNVYMNAVMKEVKMGMGRRGVRFQEEGRE